ncbi:MAG: ABC transporter ATP-binding protein [Coriobacteriales bacterium]|nr:ABC transporter ATP-binding protein [Coriobacteriales bacterium]
MNLVAEHVNCGYESTVILEDVNLAFTTGEVACILGPNGVGKTTMFKTLLGFLQPKSGKVLLDGQDCAHMSRREFAKHVAYVPQLHEPPFPYSVLDVVLAGRAAHLGIFATPAKEDYDKADEVLEELQVGFLRDRIFTECSGGEQQMALVARALVQDPQILVMDEPTASLDFGNQVRVLSCVQRLAMTRGLGVIMTTHNPDHAFLCCQRAVLITRDRKILDGHVDSIVTENNMRQAYGIEVKVTEAISDEGERIKTCVPILSSTVEARVSETRRR